MSSLDIINFFLLRDADRGSKNQDRMGDLRDRAAMIARKTGYEPVSWYEFKQASHTEEPRTVINMLAGSTFGLVVGLAAGLLIPPLQPVLIPMAISAALIGGAAGAFADSENSRRNTMLAKYEDYLDGFEAMASKERAVAQGIGYKNTHAADLLAERKAVKEKVLSI